MGNEEKTHLSPRQTLIALSSADVEAPSGLLRFFTQDACVGMFLHNGRELLWVNEEVVALTGYEREELLGRDPFDLVWSEEERKELQSRWLQRASDPTDLSIRRYEVRLRTRQGEALWVELAMQPVLLDGNLAGLGTAWDITERKLAEAALRASEERLELAQSAGEILLWEWNKKTDQIIVSLRTPLFAGLNLSEIPTRKTFLEHVHPEDLPRLQAAFQAALDGDRDFFVEHRVILPPAQTRWLAHRGRVYYGLYGEPEKMLGVTLDVTHRKVAEQALIQEKERARVTLASISDGVLRTDARGMIDFMNPSAERLTGWPLREAYGRHVREVVAVVDPETRAPLQDPVGRCLAEGRVVEYPGERLLQPRTGKPVAIRDSAAPILDHRGRTVGAVLVLRDVSELRQMEEERFFLTQYDPLTRLLNRQTFEARLEGAVQQALGKRSSLAVLLLDLDQFKLVNDSCGHFAGDALLKLVATTLRAVLPPRTELARLGEDEFAAWFEAEDPVPIAERVRQVFSPLKYQWANRRFDLTCSIGVARLEPEIKTAQELLAAVDAACFVAKRKGGNRFHLYRPGDDAVAQRLGELSWVEQIQRAFDEGRFQLFAQRIEPLSHFEPRERLAEIFLRMRTENGHYAATAAFIAAAERYRRISSLDRWVVRESLRLLGQGADEQVGVDAFSINLSGQSLGEEGFLEHVLYLLTTSNVDPHRVCFEITETAAITNLQAALRFLNQVRRVGCRVVLDDFGSGLSSFAYLRTLPIDLLKIDAAFLRDFPRDPIQRALVEAISQLGRVLGLPTIAEGVEELSILEDLRSLQVTYAQGFALHEPTPIN